jgi:hypothetical protein
MELEVRQQNRFISPQTGRAEEEARFVGKCGKRSVGGIVKRGLRIPEQTDH